MILGVDPGLEGGLALIRRTGELVAAERMPVLRNAVTTVDVLEFRRFVQEAHVDFAYVERAQAMPRQGVSSAFNYGLLFGSLLTALAVLCIGYEFVAPAKWKRALGLVADKREAVDRVRQIYPTFALKRSEDGIAEAILLARYGAGL